MPGETLGDALDAAGALERGQGIPTLITFLGENVADRSEARAVADHYVQATADADLESLIPMGPAIRMVKGAYAEPAEIAFPDKRDVDEAFFDLTTRMLAPDALEAGMRAGLATHDSALIARIDEWAQSNGVAPEAYEYQMLYGISQREQIRLARRGRGVRVLISYGEHWFPWYVRRLAERPANVAFVVRSMLPW